MYIIAASDGEFPVQPEARIETGPGPCIRIPAFNPDSGGRRARTSVIINQVGVFAMLRKFATVSLAVSFVAMATSGLMMFFIEKPSFTIQMHPVHKLFGLVMVVAAIIHVTLNFRSLMGHLQTGKVAVFGSALVIALVLLYGVAINNRVPPELAAQMDAAAARVEQRK